MLSPARRHIETSLARKAHAAAGTTPGKPVAMPTGGAVASEYRLQLMQLGEDLRALHNIQSLETKIERKRDLLPRYLPWLDGALSAPAAVQDDIVTTMMVWSIDVADWPLALRLAGHVLTHRLDLPERYKRTPACLIAEEVAEAGLKPTPAVEITTLLSTDRLTEGHDMPDEVRAKLKKAIGLAIKAQFDAFDPDADHAVAGGRPALAEWAIVNLRRALELNPGCGVKKLITTLEAATKKLDAGEPA